MITMTGIDHHAAPLEVRSVFTYRRQEMVDLMTSIREETGASGIVLLTTCNRTELYVNHMNADPDPADLTNLICRGKGIDAVQYRSYFTCRSERDAVSHLFALTSGLKSAIVAEDQILTQVKEALSFARENGFTDSETEVIFRSAVSAAKRVKSEVVFPYANRTAVSEALSRLKEQGFDPAGKTCMVIGNGEYGRLAAETLRGEGADVTMTIRQYHSGMVLIPEGCRKILYGERMAYFPQCDLVISATKSPNYTLYYEQVLSCADGRKKILIDFAVPRDIEPSIAGIEGIRVFTVDDFQVPPAPESEAAYLKAQQILDDALEDLYERLRRQDLLPRITYIGKTAGEDALFRLRRDLKKLPVSAEEKEVLQGRIGTVTEKVVEKLLFCLRDELDEETLRVCIRTLEKHSEEEEEKYYAAEKH